MTIKISGKSCQIIKNNDIIYAKFEEKKRYIEEEYHKHVGIVRNNRWNYSGKREFYSKN